MRTDRKKSVFLVMSIGKIMLSTMLIITLAFMTSAHAEPIVGDIIQFGGLDWRLLDVQGNRALIITENIVELLPYNAEPKSVTWETCTLREYLNGEFCSKFSKEEQERIIETRISNTDNLWYETNGGAETTDKVFLLSLEEVDKYFGETGDYMNKIRKAYAGNHPNGEWVPIDDGYAFINANDSDRIAKFNNEAWLWWLRSPGNTNDYAASVLLYGEVHVSGLGVGYANGGVRPALFINL